jgi:hypothetical protein
VERYIHTKLHGDSYRRSSKIKIMSQKRGRPKFWYYRKERFMTYTIEISSCDIIFLPIFMKMGIGVKKY